MKKILITLLTVGGIIGGVYGFIHQRAQSKAQANNQHTKLRVVTTNSILEDMVANVGQERVELYSIVKRGPIPMNTSLNQLIFQKRRTRMFCFIMA